MDVLPKTMTELEFLAMPERPGIDRELIRGALREYPEPIRDYAHGVLTVSIGYHLKIWLDHQPRLQGRVLIGLVRARLRCDPITIVGLDLASIPAASVPANPRRAVVIDGPPTLAVEILCPGDTYGRIDDKVEDYLDAGVLAVWIVDRWSSTVKVIRPDAHRQLFNINQELTAEPYLPGFRVAVADLFEDLN